MSVVISLTTQRWSIQPAMAAGAADAAHYREHDLISPDPEDATRRSCREGGCVGGRPADKSARAENELAICCMRPCSGACAQAARLARSAVLHKINHYLRAILADTRLVSDWLATALRRSAPLCARAF